ncbi:hypothetical protein NC652_022209 [Populus alba x Populus x berolinensis]|uniref:Uncharacterized protein n=1 Tax=Populus alba x Populus x berolinensis TaxID=444605 RepID=A0AAD6QF97_9ROSI|nr:hypothetical protein NC652_022190 [Populus alba x Populus x berolinensis]KAJ6911850.1 hypothetical protein NC652_022209 [Populus alba x Populus x berolinensis]KAJ6989320.1 hypothetical protein NC653_022029 [Populus alba x Populus x berolinensis]KAJ6989497.1 hypothetical protein NC653_022157 [Populus alba x Populus x berolinensis]KAJ6989504.1 hypothetical protein NC653_022163 [Populus alba x Populus x berolinensis]
MCFAPATIFSLSGYKKSAKTMSMQAPLVTHSLNSWTFQCPPSSRQQGGRNQSFFSDFH